METITSKSLNLETIKELYFQAFPENERRPFEDMITDTSSHIEVLAFYDGSVFCGFACLLNTQKISHIIYLAIDENLRSNGYGSQVLTLLHEYKHGSRVIVDIERQNKISENNEQRLKRKQFYLRNGYSESNVKYHWEGEDYEILVYGGNLSKQEFRAFWDQLPRSIRYAY